MVAAHATASPFTCIPDAVLRNAQVSCEARLLYSILLSYRNRTTGQCNPSLSTLAADLGCSERTTQRALTTLLDAGWLTRRPDQSPRAPWLYAFPTLRGDTPVTPSRGDTPVTPKGVRGDKPAVRGDKIAPLGVTGVSPLNKEEPDDRTRRTEPERAVVAYSAREATSSPQLDKTMAVGWPAAADETEQLRGVLGLSRAQMDACWPLLEPPYRRFRLDVQDPGQLGDIRTLVNQLRELVLRAGVPQEDLVRWQIWQMGDPWWLTARYKYNPLRVWEQSWQIWKREGQPSTFVPVAQKGRPGPGASPGDDASVYGRGARVAHQVTAAQEELACCEWCGRSVGEPHLTSRCGQEGYVQGPQDRVLPQLAYAALHEPGLRRLL